MTSCMLLFALIHAPLAATQTPDGVAVTRHAVAARRRGNRKVTERDTRRGVKSGPVFQTVLLV